MISRGATRAHKTWVPFDFNPNSICKSSTLTLTLTLTLFLNLNPNPIFENRVRVEFRVRIRVDWAKIRPDFIGQLALVDIPAPFFNITQLKSSFQQKGLLVDDLVILSGGHTIRIGHCPAFSNRLYNFTGKGNADPQGDITSFVDMDPRKHRAIRHGYFAQVSKNKGLFQPDAALLNDDKTRRYIQRQLNNQRSNFFNDFGESMVKMGKIGVLTGSAGEIRKKCAVINS